MASLILACSNPCGNERSEPSEVPGSKTQKLKTCWDCGQVGLEFASEP